MVARGEGWRDGIVREFGMDRYTVLYLKWITNRGLLCSTENSAQCYVAAWMGGECGGEWTRTHIHMNMGEPFCCSPETITALLIGLYFIFKLKKTKSVSYRPSPGSTDSLPDNLDTCCDYFCLVFS